MTAQHLTFRVSFGRNEVSGDSELPLLSKDWRSMTTTWISDMVLKMHRLRTVIEAELLQSWKKKLYNKSWSKQFPIESTLAQKKISRAYISTFKLPRSRCKNPHASQQLKLERITHLPKSQNCILTVECRISTIQRGLNLEFQQQYEKHFNRQQFCSSSTFF